MQVNGREVTVCPIDNQFYGYFNDDQNINVLGKSVEEVCDALSKIRRVVMSDEIKTSDEVTIIKYVNHRKPFYVGDTLMRWTAYRDSAPDVQGYGETQLEATKDLLQKECDIQEEAKSGTNQSASGKNPITGAD